jgi:riboflavin synthase
VNDVDGDSFGLNIVPHTLQETTFDSFQPGQTVNLEVDIIARYLERMLTGDHDQPGGNITEALLARTGFIK